MPHRCEHGARYQKAHLELSPARLNPSGLCADRSSSGGFFLPTAFYLSARDGATVVATLSRGTRGQCSTRLDARIPQNINALACAIVSVAVPVLIPCQGNVHVGAPEKPP
jgi:hypothetical protein